MHIAFFSKYLPSDEPNGVSCQVHRLANALVEAGHRLTCFSLSPRPADALYEHRLLQCSSSSRIVRRCAPALLFRSVDTGFFDVAHYHGDDFLCGGATKRRVRTFYGTALKEALHATRPSRAIVQALWYIFEWWSCLRGGTLVAISTNTCRYLPLVKKVIPCGVPLNRYTPGIEKTPYPSILFIGDLDSRKRGRAVISAFSQTVLPAMPQARLHIVGPQPYADPAVNYVGRICENRLIDEYRRCWVYVMASSYEGFGVPIIEAMACGCAVVAIENDASRAIVCDGVNGLLARPNTLGSKLLTLIDNEELRRRCIEGGMRTVPSYCIGKIRSAYEQIYAESAFPRL